MVSKTIAATVSVGALICSFIIYSSEDHVMMSSSTEPTFSGLYSYHVPTGTWNKLACDIAKPCPNAPTIRSRAGHSMLFHPVCMHNIVRCILWM